MAGIPYDQEAHYVGGKRNVIVLGRTGVGKSALANKIICQDGVFAVGHGFKTATTDIKNVIKTVKIGGKDYTINMIDTVGLQYCGFSDRSNNDIIKEIKRELKKRAPEGLHLIIFVLGCNHRFTKNDEEVFNCIFDIFANMIQNISLLVITKCNRMGPETHTNIAKQFRENPRTAKFGAMMKKGIYCVDFPDVRWIPEQERPTVQREMEDDIKPIHRTIAEAREALLLEQMETKEQMQTKDTCNIA